MNGITSLMIRAALLVVATVAGAASAAAQEVVEYIHTDALGSPVAITDASGNVIERTVYEPYGAVVNRPLKDGPGYTGHVTDSGTGLSYMQQRYYDVETGMFLSVDPVAATEVAFGRYYYANNNPYRFTDPDGRAAEDEVKPKPQPTTLPTVNAIAPPAVLPAVPIAPMPTSLPRVPWPAIGEFAIQRVALPLLLIWPTEMGASPCEMPGGPPCGATSQYSKGKENVRDSGLRDLTDEEVSRRARQPGMTGKEKRRYQTEEKARGLRNKTKREENG
ncbi:RHS repeat domain-containing protein [Stenotrophomonas lactitubi]|uniref:RHS repeat domain-containing protein n=1 Tax=Stenotrophomonas lactitubi TaxID=2045214 RepID=UPI001D6D0DB2|nr:RHS repeat-associated core domain-containing protein [Stenotrophomonas lactitubi]CAH0156843.1 tRNA3(Ser)-specific nuclease WapA [Stenotrophomonas lactitubi]